MLAEPILDTNQLRIEFLHSSVPLLHEFIPNTLTVNKVEHLVMGARMSVLLHLWNVLEWRYSRLNFGNELIRQELVKLESRDAEVHDRNQTSLLENIRLVAQLLKNLNVSVSPIYLVKTQLNDKHVLHQTWLE